MTDNPALLIFAAISPLLISFIKQAGFSRQVNALIALACYIIVGIVGVVFSGEELTVENAVQLIVVVTTVGTVAYNLIWSNIGASTDAGESIEQKLTEATSFIKG